MSRRLPRRPRYRDRIDRQHRLRALARASEVIDDATTRSDDIVDDVDAVIDTVGGDVLERIDADPLSRRHRRHTGGQPSQQDAANLASVLDQVGSGNRELLEQIDAARRGRRTRPHVDQLFRCMRPPRLKRPTRSVMRVDAPSWKWAPTDAWKIGGQERSPGRLGAITGCGSIRALRRTEAVESDRPAGIGP